MKLKILFCALMLLLSFLSCKKDEEISSDPFIAFQDLINENQLYLEPGKPITISFSTNSDWKISIGESSKSKIDWLIAEPMEGKAGNATIRVSLKDTVFRDRSTSLSIGASTANKNLSIIQKMSYSSIIADISKEADADYMLVHKDSSYMVFDFDNKLNLPVVHIGNSINDDFSNGFDIVFDEDGYPKALFCEQYSMFFGNFSKNTFDAAVVFKGGQPQYYIGIKTDMNFDELFKEINALKTQTKAFDRHNIKYLIKLVTPTVLAVSFTAAVIVGAPVAITVASIGVVGYVASELLKSEEVMIGSNLINIFTAFGTASKLSNIVVALSTSFIDVVALHMEQEDSKRVDEVLNPIIDISGITNVSFDFNPNEKHIAVRVRKGVEWSARIINNWGGCSTKVEDGKIKVAVSQNKSGKTNQCTIIVEYAYEGKCFQKEITVTQTGGIINLSNTKWQLTSSEFNQGEVTVDFYSNNTCRLTDGYVSGSGTWSQNDNSVQFSVSHTTSELYEEINFSAILSSATVMSGSLSGVLKYEDEIEYYSGSFAGQRIESEKSITFHKMYNNGSERTLLKKH